MTLEFFKKPIFWFWLIVIALIVILLRVRFLSPKIKVDKMKSIVDVSEIKDVLPKDAIPAILNPQFVKASEAELKDDDRVLSLTAGNETKAYPIRVLNWHEVVDDTVSNKPVAITFCPLCGTGMGFERIVNGQELTFGVSGKLYKNDLVMYDHQTESLWTQAGGKAIVGEMAGTKLTPIPLDHFVFSEWKKQFPDGSVLSFDTGFTRNYDSDPYLGYAQSDAIGIFGQKDYDKRLDAKALVFGIEINDKAKAYPLLELPPEGEIEDTIGDTKIIIRNSNQKSLQEAFIKKVDGSLEKIAGIQSFWFAWADFNSSTELYKK